MPSGYFDLLKLMVEGLHKRLTIVIIPLRALKLPEVFKMLTWTSLLRVLCLMGLMRLAGLIGCFDPSGWKSARRVRRRHRRLLVQCSCEAFGQLTRCAERTILRGQWDAANLRSVLATSSLNWFCCCVRSLHL